MTQYTQPKSESPPLGWDVSLYITTLTLSAKRSTRKNKERKDKESYITKAESDTVNEQHLLPSEEAPLVAPAITTFARFLTVVATILTIVAAVLAIVSASLSVVSVLAVVSILTVVSASLGVRTVVVAAATDGELDD